MICWKNLFDNLNSLKKDELKHIKVYLAIIDDSMKPNIINPKINGLLNTKKMECLDKKLEKKYLERLEKAQENIITKCKLDTLNKVIVELDNILNKLRVEEEDYITNTTIIMLKNIRYEMVYFSNKIKHKILKANL